MWDWVVAFGMGMRVVQGGLGIDRGMWRGGVFWARRCRVLPIIPQLGVKGHQACDFRGFRSPGSAWRNGKQERNFLAQNLLFVHLFASQFNADFCVSFFFLVKSLRQPSFFSFFFFRFSFVPIKAMRNWK
jgi:hypothetical protein